MNRFYRPAMCFGVQIRSVPPAYPGRIVGLWNLRRRKIGKCGFQTGHQDTRLSRVRDLWAFPLFRDRRKNGSSLNGLFLRLNEAVKSLFKTFYPVLKGGCNG